jgi:hypothetical protein
VVKLAFILATEVQPVECDVNVAIRVGLASRRTCISIGSPVAKKRLNEQTHVVGKTHGVGVRRAVTDDHDRKDRGILGSRRPLPLVLEAAHRPIEWQALIGRQLGHEIHLLRAAGRTKCDRRERRGLALTRES